MKFFTNLWRSIFPPNDWVLVWSDYAEWKIVRTKLFKVHDERRDICFYKIYYSKYRRKYILETSGYRPNEHKFLNEANQMLIKLQSKLNES